MRDYLQWIYSQHAGSFRFARGQMPSSGLLVALSESPGSPSGSLRNADTAFAGARFDPPQLLLDRIAANAPV